MNKQLYFVAQQCLWLHGLHECDTRRHLSSVSLSCFLFWWIYQPCWFSNGVSAIWKYLCLLRHHRWLVILGKSRAADMIKVSASPSLHLVVCPFDCRIHTRSSVNCVLFLVFVKMPLDPYDIWTHQWLWYQLVFLAERLRCSWSFVDGPSYPSKTTQHNPYLFNLLSLSEQDASRLAIFFLITLANSDLSVFLI